MAQDVDPCMPPQAQGWGALVSYRPLAAQVAEAATGHTYT